MFEKKIKQIDVTDALKEKKKFSINEDDIKPILAYSVFTMKYILKKKSTILMPIASFFVLLMLTIIPSFFKEVTADIFTKVVLLVVSSICISITSVFATIKGLNLFKDISSEGMEIIIVSKPIKRSQIILVRFIYFFLLGIILCLLNYFAILIGLLSSANLVPESFSIFKYISLFFISMLLIYIFFGSLSILLSLKFSTKLVSSFSLGFLSMGTLFAQLLPQVAPMIEKGFTHKYSDISFASTGNYSSLKYKLTSDGKIIIYTKDVNTPLTPDEIKFIIEAMNTKDDYSWINIVNNFLNPIAGISKISSVASSVFNNNSYGEKVNFTDYYISFNESQKVINNLWENKNYFLGIDDLERRNDRIKFTLKVKTSQNPEFHNEDILLTNFYSLKSFFEDYINLSKVEKVFNSILDENLNNLNELEIIKIIMDKSQGLFDNALDKEFLNDPTLKNLLGLTNTNSNEIIEIDKVDFKEKLTILFFYLWGLKKLDNNMENFINRDIFINSIIEGEKSNKFLNISFSLFSYDDSISPFFFTSSMDNQYDVFVSGGEKASSLAVGLLWSGIILIILSSTIVIYYKKDFE